jgi:hypothetical protein
MKFKVMNIVDKEEMIIRDFIEEVTFEQGFKG